MSTTPMTNHRLGEIVREHADTMHQDEAGRWQFDYIGFQLIVLTDETNNRMRVISPIANIEGMDEALLLECLSANFDRALDARYATSGGILWSAFIHPLSELSEQQVVAAINQVARLSTTFGTTFTSTDLSFG